MTMKKCYILALLDGVDFCPFFQNCFEWRSNMKIPVYQLKDGIHKLEEVIKGGELHFYEEQFFPNDIYIQAVLSKFNENITLKVDLETKAKFECDRCLQEFDKIITGKFNMLFYTGSQDIGEDEDDVVIIKSDDKEIDINDRIIESLVLSVPIKKLCSEDCKGICPHCGADLNHEPCKCPDTPVDPRWDNLRKLLK